MSLGQPARINTLPSEILSSTFVTIVDASLYARSIGDSSYGSYEYPTLISSVCAHWRRVSIGIPHLWTYIDLMPLKYHLRNSNHLKLWLKRSQNSALRLRLGKGNEDQLPEHVKEPLASILASAAPRVHSFTLKFNDLDFATEALSILLSKAEQHPIRELALRRSGWSLLGYTDLLPQSEWDRLLEPLRALYLERCNIALDTISCRNLVELQLISPSGFPPIAHFAKLFESNLSLRTLVLDDLTLVNMHPPPPPQSINLPSLRYLRLSARADIVMWLFKTLVLGPYELDLRLNNIVHLAPGNTSLVDAMVSFFQRTRIKSLYLQLDKISLSPILASLPHLQALGLSTFNFDRDILAGLEAVTNLLPKLHTIDLNECDLEDHSNLPPGLRALLSLPFVRRIRHLNCGHRDKQGSPRRKSFIELLEGGGFAATVVHASPLDFEDRASPFQ